MTITPTGVEIGTPEEQPEITIEPIENPVPQPDREPVTVPERELIPA